MRRLLLSTLLVLLSAAPVAVELGAQSLPDPILPRGQVRVGLEGFFEAADDRFASGGEVESLAFDLIHGSGSALFPGAADLRALFAEALASDASALPLRLPASDASLRTNVFRVPFSVDVGVFDWLSLGVTVPLVKTRVEGTLAFGFDADADLGLNPALANLGSVQTFLDALTGGADAATGLAATRCGSDPGSQACLDAQDLAAELTGTSAAFTNAYAASLLFPAAGTEAGTALTGRITELNGKLVAQGLPGMTNIVPLADVVLDDAALQELLIDPAGPYGYLAPVGTLGGLWGLGDIEARLAIRLLDGPGPDSTGAAPRVSWRLAALGAVRLPTATGREPDALFLPARGDGQLDLEAGLYGEARTGRFVFAARTRYTLQQSGEVADRVRPTDVVLVSGASRALLDWDPGDLLEIELQPSFRLSRALTIGGLWRYLDRGEDRYERVSPLPAAPAERLPPRAATFVDPSLLAVGSGGSVHEVGLTVTFQSTHLPDSDGRGFEMFVDLRRALSGSGGLVPKSTRAVFGVRFVRRLWGGE